MCLPRIQAYDRLRGRYETFANCGAVAGVLARLDEQRSPWQAGPDDELLLRPGTRATIVLNEAERLRLAAHGVNPLQSLRSGESPVARTAYARRRCRPQFRQHAPHEGSRVRPVRSNWLPAGTRMSVKAGAEAAVAESPRPRTVAQELFGHYSEPRPAPSSVATVPSAPEAPAAGRVDLEAISRFHQQDFGRRDERL